MLISEERWPGLANTPTMAGKGPRGPGRLAGSCRRSSHCGGGNVLLAYADQHVVPNHHRGPNAVPNCQHRLDHRVGSRPADAMGLGSRLRHGGPLLPIPDGADAPHRLPPCGHRLFRPFIWHGRPVHPGSCGEPCGCSCSEAASKIRRAALKLRGAARHLRRRKHPGEDLDPARI